MFFGASSTAIDLVAVIAQPFEALYQVRPGRGRRPGGRGGGQDRAAALPLHGRHHRQRGMIDRLHVDGGDQVEGRLVDLQHVAVPVGVAGVVDHDVDAAEGVLGRIDHLVDLGADRDVGGDRDGRLADLAGDALGALGVEIGDDDLRALFGETLRHAFAEPRRRAGDDGDLAFQTHLSSRSEG